jgi:hypothetical protein
MYTSGIDHQLLSAIDSTQTTGILIAPRIVNGASRAFSATSGILQFTETVPGGIKVEWIKFTNITDEGNDVVELTGVVRGLAYDSNSEVGGEDPQTFSRGATVRLVVDHRALNFMPRTNTVNTYTAKQIISGGWEPPVFASAAARDAAFPTPWNGLWCIVTNGGLQEEHVYYNSTWNVTGITTPLPSATESLEGKAELATLAEHISATTGPKVIQAKNTRKNSTGAAEGIVPVLDSTLSIDETLGGTGQTTYTKGDILGATGPNALGKLAVGTDGQILQADAASPHGFRWFTLNTAASYLLGSVHTDVTVTGTTTETSLFSIVVPGGAMGINGVLRVRVHIPTNNRTATNSIRLKFGGSNVFAFAYTNATNYENCIYDFEIRNKGSLTSQEAFQTMNRASSASSSYTANTAINTAINQTLEVTAQLGSSLGGNTVTFDSATIEILK